MERCQLAFCIPTYNRSIMIEEFLEQFSALFYELGIDIYYYDSSENEETRLVVEKWMLLYKNICYIRIPSTWHANKKVQCILEQYGVEQKYNYLWVCGDSVRFSELALRKILPLLDQKYDMIIVSGTEKGQLGTREYTDKNELFQNCAWHMTLFGAVILNVHTMLKEVPWMGLKEKYETSDRINYSHVGYYFEIICKLEKFRAYHLTVDRGIQTSRLKLAGGWYHDAFKVLCEYWPSTIDALPQCYMNKKDAINKLGYYSCLTPRRFLHYRRGNVYNINTLLRYRTALKDMSRLNIFQLWSLSCLNPKLAYYIAANDLKGYIKDTRKIHRLRGFCKKHHAIYIYGAGKIAELYGKYMQRKGIAFQGFLVTQKEKNPEILQDHPVIPLSDFEDLCEGTGIIIGLNQQNIKEVQPIIKELGLWKNTFHEYILPVILEK
ncbi:glycosyltransferase [Lacrimispora sp.]|jgi:hypothetical protein|uniref:glycosyltransferase n=1 Tax=Lacrimispora sp. TaxID=2719234 RepID=UPI002896E1D9|nr:glycosyltransferase [Lacrimispora sp.]